MGSNLERILGRFITDSDLETLWINMHSNAHRSYHNRDHISDVVDNVYSLCQHEEYVALEEILFSALFHDFFYNPFSQADDVGLSAQMALVAAKDGPFDEFAAGRIFAMVLSTGINQPTTIDQRILCDSDLAILGSTPSKYSDYRRKIRNEFHLIPDETFMRGRLHILKTIAAQDTIYHTKKAQEWWESNAQKNLSTEIAELEKKVDKL